jgi:hypothetical protein
MEEAMRHASRLFIAAASAALLSALGASAALGADATGCSGSATSYSADSAELMSVTAPGPSATQADPFKVDYEGSVAWKGTTDSVIQNGSWTVTARPFSFGGDVANDSGKQEAEGTITPSDYLSFAIPGLVLVTVDLTGADGATCSVTGWIRFQGNPLASPAGWVALAFTVLGALGFLVLVRFLVHRPTEGVRQNRFGRVILGLLTGLVLGMGVALLLVMYAVTALGTMVPLLVVGGTMLVGVVLGLLPRKMPVS